MSSKGKHYNRVAIPNQRKYSAKSKYKEEVTTVGQMSGFDKDKVAGLINAMFLMLDIADNYATEAEAEMRHTKISIHADIKLIKTIAARILSQVDSVDIEFSESFAKVSDGIKEIIDKNFFQQIKC